MKKKLISITALTMIALTVWASNLSWTDVTGAASIQTLLAAPGAAKYISIRSMIVSATSASSVYFCYGAAYPYTQTGPTMVVPANGNIIITDESLGIDFPANTAAKITFSAAPNNWSYKYEVVDSVS